MIFRNGKGEEKNQNMILPQGYRSVGVNITPVFETTVASVVRSSEHTTGYMYDVTTAGIPEMNSLEIFLSDKWFLFALLVAGVWFIFRLLEFFTGKKEKCFNLIFL